MDWFNLDHKPTEGRVSPTQTTGPQREEKWLPWMLGREEGGFADVVLESSSQAWAVLLCPPSCDIVSQREHTRHPPE